MKSVAKKDDWILGNRVHESSNHFYVLVGYEGKFGDSAALPRLWIIPSAEMSPLAKVASDKKMHFVPRKAFLETGGRYENAWELLK